jgi:tetratricopeptide (TPR) repeat protein
LVVALGQSVGRVPLGGFLSLAVSVGLLLSSSAQAQEKALSETEKAKAKEAYEKATRFYNVGRYAEAIEEYQNVYLITADAAMLVNIAQAYRLSEQLPEAARFYKRYLSTAPPDAPGRAFAEKRLAEVEKLIEERKKPGATTPPAPPDPVAPAPPPVVAPGPVAPPPPVVASPPVAEPAPAAPPPAAPEPRRPSRVLPVTLLVAGGVLLAGSAGFAIFGQNREDALESAARKGSRFDPKIERDGNSANALAVVTGVLGLGAGVTGAVLLARTPSNPEPAQARRSGGAPSLAAIAPVLGPGFAGASAQVVF